MFDINNRDDIVNFITKARKDNIYLFHEIKNNENIIRMTFHIMNNDLEETLNVELSIKNQIIEKVKLSYFVTIYSKTDIDYVRSIPQQKEFVYDSSNCDNWCIIYSIQDYYNEFFKTDDIFKKTLRNDES